MQPCENLQLVGTAAAQTGNGSDSKLVHRKVGIHFHCSKFYLNVDIAGGNTKNTQKVHTVNTARDELHTLRMQKKLENQLLSSED
uniref:Uncharacterized protein n=1 Tax=Anguilla anguilla TaxID=7936 RepID=A0A0E9W5C9_ANGAN